ncbi:MAG TPA: fumarylacetoacetase [Pirellulales bacterium]|nr:fumarylacetoacetase [Pirellulales bacterium]
MTTPSSLRSFVEVAADSHFPIQNLPYGVFRPRGAEAPRVGVAIGELILDLAVLEREGLLHVPRSHGETLFDRPSLNAWMALGREAWVAVRRQLTHLLDRDEPTLRDDAALRREALVPRAECEMLLPVEIADFTDFYSSREHATNVGAMLRSPENPLMPNWLWVPIAYHGRASSVVVGGTDLPRPCGQLMADGAAAPTFAPSRAVDFELEVGYFIGPGNRLGEPIAVDRAAEHVFGLVLVNDWSARDIQKWEYVPLGPFLAKSFGTSISPWVVTLEALEPFRVSGPPQDPPPLAYLQSPGYDSYDIHLEVSLQTSTAGAAERICASNFRGLYWSLAQQIAHHTSNGCNLRTGDLLASGTISGSTPAALGCLLELTRGGKQPLKLADGSERRFLEDGDRVTMTGWCQADGYRVGFGEVTGRILPARPIRPAV